MESLQVIKNVFQSITRNGEELIVKDISPIRAKEPLFAIYLRKKDETNGIGGQVFVFVNANTDTDAALKEVHRLNLEVKDDHIIRTDKGFDEAIEDLETSISPGDLVVVGSIVDFCDDNVCSIHDVLYSLEESGVMLLSYYESYYHEYAYYHELVDIVCRIIDVIG